MKTKLLPKLFFAFASMLLMVVVVSCTNENDTLSKGTAVIQLKLTDAPSMEYDAVYIDIQGVRVGIADEYFYADDPYYEDDADSTEGPDDVEWVDLELSDPGLYNLLDYGI